MTDFQQTRGNASPYTGTLTGSSARVPVTFADQIQTDTEVGGGDNDLQSVLESMRGLPAIVQRSIRTRAYTLAAADLDQVVPAFNTGAAFALTLPDGLGSGDERIYLSLVGGEHGISLAKGANVTLSSVGAGAVTPSESGAVDLTIYDQHYWTLARTGVNAWSLYPGLHFK